MNAGARGRGQLEGQGEMGTAIPQQYPEVASDGQEARKPRVVRLRGGLNTQPDM